MKKCALLLTIFFMTGIMAVMAQTKRVTGVVTSSEDGSPITGVSVVVKGTTIGAVTDLDGRYQIDVPSGAKVLHFSFVGMKNKDVSITGTTLNVALNPESNMLSELVVTGYGVTKKAAFTGAAEKVDAKTIRSNTDANFMKSLESNVAGLQMNLGSGQPGAYNEVLIRGMNSMNSGTTPLYVIDGIPITVENMGVRASSGQTVDPLATINSADIESVTVLKDATATSIYGARAANGVIVITTKKGKEGKTKVEFSAKGGVSLIPARNSYKKLNASQYIDFIETGFVNAGTDPYTGNAMTDKKAAWNDMVAIGLVNPNNIANTDWYKEVTRTGKNQEYNLDISGGNDKTKFFISGGYYDEQGIVIAKDLKRYSGRLNLENKASNIISLGINTTASYTDMNNSVGGGAFSDPITAAYNQVIPTDPVKNKDGTWNMSTLTGYNPVAQYSNNGDRANVKEYKAIVSPWVTAKLMDELTFTSRAGLDYYNLKEFDLWSTLQPQGNDMNMMGEENNEYRTMWTWTNTLNYIKTFNNIHSLNLLVGQEAQKATDSQSFLAGENYPTGSLYTVENAATHDNASTSFSNYALISYFANAEYSYMDKYYLSGSFRYDGSSRFGKNNRYAPFWSVGGKYRISQEDFLKDYHWLDNLTVRSSYGTTGNQDIGWYSYQGLYGFGYNYLKNPGMLPIQIENKDLKWEQTAKFNVGFELGIFNRLSIDFDYYNDKTTNMIFQVPVSLTTGYSTVTGANADGVSYIQKNIGSMRNRGLELVLTYNAIKSTEFNWNISLNATHNSNKILALSTDQPIVGTYTIRAAGHPYNTFYMKKYAGVDSQTGAPLWYDAKGKTTTSYSKAAYQYMGSADPKIFGSLTNEFKFSDFDFAFTTSYKLGNKIYNSAARYDMQVGGKTFTNTTEYVYENAWTTPGQITDVPKIVFGRSDNAEGHSSRFLMNGSYIKMKSAILGYTLPKDITNRLTLSNIRFYVSADNIYTWALSKNFHGISPEADSDGILWWNYPVPRKILFGVNVSF